MQTEPTIVTVILASIGGAVFLQLFFGLVATRWPESYYSAADIVDRSVSGKWYRYPIFRLLPVYVVLVVVAGSVAPSGYSTALAISSTVIMHLAITVGRALLENARKFNFTSRSMLVQLAVAMGVGATALAAFATVNFWVRYLPGFDKYVEVLSTGAVAAIATLYLQRWTTSGRGGFDYNEDLLKTVARNHIDAVVRSCKKHRVDRDLGLSILISENMQRPRALRSTEGVVAKLAPSAVRTFGPMQGSAVLDVTDDKSIDDSIQNLAGAVLPRSRYSVRTVDLHVAIERHNRSDVFVKLVDQVFTHISAATLPSTRAVGLDGSPAIRRLGQSRNGSVWTVWGDLDDDVEIVGSDCRREPAYGSDEQLEVSALLAFSITQGRYRRIWTARFSVFYDSMRLIGRGSAPEYAATDYMLEVSPSVYG